MKPPFSLFQQFPTLMSEPMSTSKEEEEDNVIKHEQKISL